MRPGSQSMVSTVIMPASILDRSRTSLIRERRWRPDVLIFRKSGINSLAFDSSASSCAWGSGSRIVNGTVNVLPDGTILTPLYTLFGQAGWKRALVTTTEITHATPAGFAASGLKPKDLCMIPWRVAIALQADGWWVRSVICW